MLKKILLTLDGSDLAEQALPHALELAEAFTAELVIVRVIQPTYIMAEYGGVVPANFMIEEEKAIQAYLTAIEARLAHRPVSVRTIALHHTLPADGIIDLAEGEAVDLIVMCTHGRSGLGRWIHGSVASKVLQYAPCPVYLVKASPVEVAEEVEEVLSTVI